MLNNNNNNKLNEFKEQLLIFETIGDVVAGSLKGNPRQAKRFLNTFYIRKRMAEIQKFNPDLAVLAKLMVLEEIDNDLFNELYIWQSQNEGKADKLKEVYANIKDEKDLNETSYSKWNKDKIKNWVVVEPVNLYETDLRQYFYLSRESIGEVSFVKNNLTFEERKRVNDICSSEDTTYQKKLIEALKSIPEEISDKIVKAVLLKFRQNHQLFEGVVNIYRNFERHRDNVIREFKHLTSEDVTGSNIKLLLSLKNDSDQRIDILKNDLIQQGVLDNKKIQVWSRLEGGKR